MTNSSSLKRADYAGFEIPAHEAKNVRRLYNLALSKPNRIFIGPGFIEGPYGSHPANHSSYGTTVLFSAGAGITHHLLYTRDLVLRAAAETAATRRVYLIWSVRSTDHLTWVSKWMDQILKLPLRREILIIKLFVSKPRRAADIVSPSKTVQMFSGRCKPDVVLDEILPERVGATLVSVCGPGAFADHDLKRIAYMGRDAHLPVQVLVVDLIRNTHVAAELLSGDDLVLKLGSNIC